MKGLRCVVVALLASCPTGSPDSSPAQDTLHRVTTAAAVAFMGASVVDVVAGTVVAGRTVVVRGDRIESVGGTPPADAILVSARGKFLAPGLIDSHVHIREKDLAAYVDAGITSVRHMWGYPGLLELADRIVRQHELSPTIYAASPGVDGPGSPWPYTQLIEDPAAADALIRALRDEGWRWIKVYPHLARPVYEAVLAAAARRGIRVIGHVPFSLPIEDAMAEGHYSVEHLVGYERSLVQQSGGFYPDWANADASRMPGLAALTARLGAWNCPTLAIIAIYARTQDPQGTAATNRKRMVGALRDAGARLLAGTDSGIDVTQPGASLHEELKQLASAGLSNAEALRAATASGAEFLGEEGQIGTIAAGARADLLVLDHNPLEDLSALWKPPLIMLRGTLYERH